MANQASGNPMGKTPTTLHGLWAAALALAAAAGCDGGESRVGYSARQCGNPGRGKHHTCLGNRSRLADRVDSGSCHRVKGDRWRSGRCCISTRAGCPVPLRWSNRRCGRRFPRSDGIRHRRYACQAFWRARARPGKVPVNSRGSRMRRRLHRRCRFPPDSPPLRRGRDVHAPGTISIGRTLGVAARSLDELPTTGPALRTTGPAAPPPLPPGQGMLRLQSTRRTLHSPDPRPTPQLHHPNGPRHHLLEDRPR